MATNRSFAKDFHNLLRNISSISGGQACISDWDDEDVSKFDVEISPSDGLYKGGKFKFQFELYVDSYPESTPKIICKTPIYHPNIDTIDDSFDDTNVCVSLLDDWSEDNSIDDCVQALLFLFYNPNLEDPLCPIICPETTEDEFGQNVKISLEGGDVEGVSFERNYGYPCIENEIVQKEECVDVQEIQSVSQEEPIQSVSQEEPRKTDVPTNLNIGSSYTDSTTEMSATTNDNIEIENTGQINETDMNQNDVSDTNNGMVLILDSQCSKANKLEQNSNKMNILMKFLPSNRMYRSGTIPLSFKYYVFDNLVPYNTIVSVMCSHLIRRVWDYS